MSARRSIEAPHRVALPWAAVAVAMALCTLGAGCGISGAGGGDDDDGVLGGSLTVTGSVVDFQSGAAIASEVTVQTSGLIPAPTATLNGAEFAITGVPENSAFQILASSPPAHRATFSPSVVVVSNDLAGVKAPVVSEAFLAGLATAFGVNPTAARGVLLARVVDAAGMPKPGVAATNFVVAGGTAVDGPNFLNADLAAAPNLTATSTSGWVVFFEIAPGVVSLGTAAQATVTLDMAISPVNAGTVTVAEIKATDGAPPVLKNVSFENQVVPIFTNRGCIGCHKGNGVGTDLGGLSLNQGATKVYDELTSDPPKPPRVIAGMPEKSLVLTMPSREDPADRHPNITFNSPNDPDYQKLYVWIKEGAKLN